MGCGRKTPVLPPELVAPEAVRNLSVRVLPKGVRLSWGRPQKRVSGQDLEDLAGFIVLRETDNAQGWQRIATLTVEDRDRFRKAKRFSYTDGAVEVGVRYRYQVRAFTLDGQFSAASNIVEAVWQGGS